MSRRSSGDGPAAAPIGPVSSARRPSTAQAVLVYSAGRLVAFLVSLGVLRLLGFRTYALFLGALVLSALLSLLLLRRQRAAVSESLATRPKRDALTRRPSERQVGVTDAQDDDGYDPYADDDDDVPDSRPASGADDAQDGSAPPSR